MFGYTSEELIGRSMWDFLSGESKAIIKQKLEKGWKNVNESFEIKFIRKDGYPFGRIQIPNLFLIRMASFLEL